MRYACAAATERRADMLATIVKKMMRNRCGKCINALERQHVNRRVLIRKRLREHVKNSTSCLAPTAQRLLGSRRHARAVRCLGLNALKTTSSPLSPFSAALDRD